MNEGVMYIENLTIELLCEELPPKSLKNLASVFSDVLTEQLRIQGLLLHDSETTTFATPRRLGAHITQVRSQAPDQSIKQKIMPVSIGLKNNEPTSSLFKKLASLGLDATISSQLLHDSDGKNEVLSYNTIKIGDSLADGLQKALQHTINKLPIRKVLTYQLADGWTDVAFVRPAHRLLALHGPTIVPISILGLKAGRLTQGHRFEALSNPLELDHADQYEELLGTSGQVMASLTKRRENIACQLTSASKSASSKSGAELHYLHNEELLDEVTSLVERPNVLICMFEKEFLIVPQECLILTMKANQKYFPLLDKNEVLTNQFLVVANITPDDPSDVIQGNEKVIRPRLADAKFFYDQDRKKSLADRRIGLRNVVYHNQLGSQYDRMVRVVGLSEKISALLLEQRLIDTLISSQAKRAAELAKCDLLTDMVNEFPELQGTMGCYYARHDGEGIAVAEAIEDHYKPRFSGDDLPRSAIGSIVALADKLELLAGMFLVGNFPSGDKDPYALRRHAFGVLRLLIENKWPLQFDDIFCKAYATVSTLALSASALDEGLNNFKKFMRDRLTVVLKDKGYDVKEIESVLILDIQNLPDIIKRLDAVHAFSQYPQAQSLAVANKRIANILKKTDVVDPHVSVHLLVEPAEKALYEALQQMVEPANRLYELTCYVESMKELAMLRESVDSFFVHVMVNCEQEDIRLNRLALLQLLSNAMNKVANLGKLA
jgi:glycyl-tRNA synthetase beta chain